MYHRLRVASPAGHREIDLGTPVAGRETLTGWYWRELTSMDYGVIVEQLHYPILASRLLAGTDQIATSVVLDQFYKNPQLPLPASEGVLARAIQLGVQDGALGLAELKDGSPDPWSLRFGVPLALTAIDFSQTQVVLTRERAETLEAASAAQQAADQGTQVATATGAITVAPKAARAAADIAKTDSVSGPDRGGLAPGPGSERTPPQTTYHRVRLAIAGVAASKIADVDRGIFLPLSALVDGDLTFTLEIDVTSAEGIPARTLEQTIKETVRRIGARIVEEEKG